MSAITLLHAQRGRAVFIAVPAYQSVSPATAYALFEESSLIDAEIAVLAHCCHVDDARNILVRRFLDTDCTDLVFIDTDLAWERGALARLLSYDADIVAGSYPTKLAELKFPLRWLEEGDPSKDDQGLIEVKAAPTGFMRIRRRVFEALEPHQAKFRARHEDVNDTAVFFERGFFEGARVGGDYMFCAKARAAGFRVFVDPEIYFQHGTIEGSLGAFLRKQQGAPLGHALELLRDPATYRFEGSITRACRELYDAWGNRWGLDPPAMVVAVTLARDKRSILDVGSGISTLALAAAAPDATVHALEENAEWAARVRGAARLYGLDNVVVHEAPLVTDGAGAWYPIPPDLPDRLDFVLVDGPPLSQRGDDGRTRDDQWRRLRIADRLGDRIADAVMLFDDAKRMPALRDVFGARLVPLGDLALCLPAGAERAVA